MKPRVRLKAAASRVMVMLLAAAMVLTMMPALERPVYADSALQVQTPVLVATGSDLVGDYHSVNGVSREKSWTLDELKALEGVRDEMYSAKQQQSPYTKSYNLVDGVKVSSLIGDLTAFTDVTFLGSDGYPVTFKSNAGSYDYEYPGTENVAGLASGRYYYEDFSTAGTPKEVPAVISWAFGRTEGRNGEKPSNYPTATEEKNYLRLFCGQLASPGLGPEDMNGQLFNGKDAQHSLQQIIAGDDIAETALTVGSTEYTRSDVLLMDFAENSYSYSTSNGDATDYVRGVPMSVLLDGYGNNDVVTFEAADGYPVAASSYTVKQLIDNDYMLAYEKGTSASDLAGIYETAKKDATKYGFFTLYGSDANGKPAKLVNKITVTSSSGIDFSTSPYKHITNGGQPGSSPYNIDSITGATLTVEGPGVKTSVPVSVRDLEGRDAGAVRAVYTDKREGMNVSRMYEGIDLYYILHNMTSGDNGIQMTDRAEKVQIKNRNRNTIAEFSVDQVNEAHESDTPIIVAYGTATTDETNIRPFVFDNGAGADRELGNEDGCIKLVYNKDSITGDTNNTYKKFGNMAYIYVAEANTPGYKHDKDPYQSPEISNYVLTVTGDKIGMEVNYTVQQLENMVGYGSDGKPDNSGMGYRDEYSLANSNYWYVNEYEGVQLWKLLLKSGLDPALAADSEGKQTIVSSTATDGYTATDRYTIEEVSDPDKFGFYEKNPLDQNDGTYEGNENIRQGDDVSTGDKLRVGYPILVAYGVNGYPYVEKSSQEGYLSGLQNDGGPLRVISGKRAYNHANGSNQAKLLDKIIVGENTYHYSTHKYHSDNVYKGIADNELSISVLNGSDDDAPVIKEDTYTVGDIEEFIHGNLLTRNQLAEAKIKTFYQLSKNGNAYSDLYEGINLNFFLKNIVEIPGYKGTITFSNGTNELVLNLEDVLSTDNGSNTETGVTGLTPLLAYSKNGAPMVSDKNAEGYVKNVSLAAGTDYENEITVKNDGGPLAVLFPHTDSSVSDQSLTNVTSITINLSADKYAHTSAPYDTYADNTIKIFGEGTRFGEEGKNFALSELEGKQTIAFTGDYSILNSSNVTTQVRYRGINLYSLLTSTSVGLKSNADKVIISTTDGESKEFTLSQIRKSDYINSVTGEAGLPVILAYGTGKAGTDDKEDGLPLVAEKSSAGYNAEYSNNGGPVRFVIGQTDAEDVNSGKNMKYVSSIEVTASEMDSWNHNTSEIYRQYRDETVELAVKDKDGASLFNRTYTVGEIEDNTSLVERITATVVQESTWEGILFWRWVKQEAGNIEGIDDPVSITVTAADGFSSELRSNFGMDALVNGIKDGDNYVPIILAYGIGGYPLVIGDKTHSNGEGYDATAGNNGGPLRLVTHNTQGTSLTYVKKVTVVVGEGGEVPPERADFTIKGVGDGDITMSVADISSLKNSSGDEIGKAEAEYTSKKNGTETVKGVYLKNLLAAKGVVNENTVITLNATDGYENSEASYRDITLKDASDQNYFVAYQVLDAGTGEWVDIADSDNKDNPEAGNITPVRIYREYNEALGNEPTTDWRNRCTSISGITLQIPEITQFKEYPTSGGIRSTSMDNDNTIWVGTYGGGLYSKAAGAQEFTVLNTGSTPALKTDFTSAVAADAEGGVWVSQNASYTQPDNNQGVLYIKDGEITQYTVENNPGTIPNNYVQAIKVGSDGKVWFGSFGGLTIYDPAEDSWVTYSKADKDFPATSVCAITLDGNGGAWLGFYPDGSGTEASPYAGGFCHITSDGTVDKVVPEGGVGDPMFAQSWVRSIAIDQKGTVWAVAAGTNIPENVGGVVWKWQSSKNQLSRYTGKELFPAYLNGSNTTEVRVVGVDDAGSLWFGTSADGVLRVDNPKINGDGTMTVDAQYAKETGSWSAANMNNVYSIDFWNGGTAYVGSSGGLLVLGAEPEPEVKPAGDATPEDAALTITGDALARDGYFSIKGIKNAEGIVKITAVFPWVNSVGTSSSSAVEGATIENILNDVIGLADGAEIGTVEAISSDGRSTIYSADEILNTDISGNKAMFIWKEDGGNVQKTIVGQFAEGEQNRGKWAKDVIKIVVSKKTDEPGTGPAGDATADTADLTITGDALARDGYFTIKGIKNTDGINRVDATFSWQNSSGTTGESTVQGATLENIFSYIGIAEGAEIDTVEAVSNDGRSTIYSADEILTSDISGNKAMFIWKEDGGNVQKTIVGQFTEGDVNRGKWAKDVEKIIVNKKTEDPGDSTAGDATADTADLTITGDALARDGYFTIKGIKNTDGINRVDATFSWRNSYGTLGSSTVQGATLDNIIEYIGLAEGAEVDSAEIICSDGFTVTFTADEIYNTDMDGNKAMFIWTQDSDKVQKAIIGRFEESDVNLTRWARNVETIIVNAKAEQDDSTAGDATAETADLAITGDALARDGYFTIKGIKNTEGIDRVDATFGWRNSSGTTGEATVQGATLENIFDYIGIADLGDDDQIEVVAVSSDGRTTTYSANEIYDTDIDGNQAMFIWKEDGGNVQKTIVGQFSEDEANKGKWAKDVIEIKVNIHTHTPGETAVIENEIAASCSAEGSYDEVVYCTGCGEELSRNHVVTDKTPHTWNEGEVAVEATCTTKGVTTYTCTVCGATESEENIDALDHRWGEPEYTVAEDNSSVTAWRECLNDGNHVEIETAYTTQETVAAGCEEPGTVTYSVEFENPAFSYESWTEDLTQIGHDWDVPTFEWAEDNSSVTATRVCRRDPSHTETETVDTTSAITKEPTCEEKGETTYTAEFINDGFGVQTKVVDNIEAAGHEWDDAEYEWASDHSKVTASHTCINNPSHVETETVETTSEVAAEPTYDREGDTKYTAVFTVEGFEGQTRTVTDIPTLQQTSEEKVEDAAAQEENAMSQALQANTAVDSGSVNADEIISGATTVVDAAQEAAAAAQEAADQAYDSAVNTHGEDSDEAQTAKAVAETAAKIVASTKTAVASVKTAAAKSAGKKADAAQKAADSAAVGTADAVDKAQTAETAAAAAVAAAEAANNAAQEALRAAEEAGLGKGDELYDAAAAAAAAAEADLNAANDALKTATESVKEAKNAKEQADAAAEAQKNADAAAAAKAAAEKDAAAKAAAAKQAEIAANNGILDPKLPKVKIRAPKKAKKSFTAKWKKLSKKQQKVIKGIEVEYSLTKDFSNPKFKTAGKKKTSVKIKKLKSKKTYYVRAHTYVIRGGTKYVSSWSKVRKVKVK